MPLPTRSVSLPVSERPFSALSSRTTSHRSNVASNAIRDAHLRAFRIANFHANHDANYAANFSATSDASTGAIRLQFFMPIAMPLSIAQVQPTIVPTQFSAGFRVDASPVGCSRFYCPRGSRGSGAKYPRHWPACWPWPYPVRIRRLGQALPAAGRRPRPQIVQLCTRSAVSTCPQTSPGRVREKSATAK